MNELPDIPFVPRPSSGHPTQRKRLLAILGVVLAWLGVIGTNGRLDGPVQLLWVLAIGLTGLLAVWAALGIATEMSVALRRLRSYADVYAAAIEAHRQNSALAQSLAFHAQFPESTQTFAYEVVDCVLSKDKREVLVTLNDDGKPILEPGLILTLADKHDGMPLGSLEVTNEQTVLGRRLVRIKKADGLVAGFLRSHAENRTRREHFQVHAIFTRYQREEPE